jgi:hypothetical protein
LRASRSVSGEDAAAFMTLQPRRRRLRGCPRSPWRNP